MLLHHLKIAIRNLRKYKSQTLIGVLGLATACIVFALICDLIYFEILLQNSEIPNNKRMYEMRTQSYRTTINGDMKRTLDEMSGIEKYTAFVYNSGYGHFLKEDNEPEERIIHLQLLDADTSFLSFFSIEILMATCKPF
jgi:hypothetical protein